MKVVVLSDIHSNGEALEAVIADAEKQKPDRYVVAGDIISDGPSAREVLERVRALTPYVIKGNREDYMLRYRSGEFAVWNGRKQFATLVWTYSRLRPHDLDYINSLPEQITIELDARTALRVVHGSPFNMYELLKPHEDMAAVERSALAVREQALVFGHNHMQWTGTVQGRLLLNPGTVGVHFNSECKAEYGMLAYAGGKLSAGLRRVPYDVAALEKKLESSGLAQASPVWSKITFEGVKAGRNYCIDFLKEAKGVMDAQGVKEQLIPNDIWDSVAQRWWREKGWGPAPVG